jgi:hypothetical protein
MHPAATLLAVASPLLLAGEGAAPSSSSRLHPMHAAVASFGAAVHDGWLYVAGGHVGETHVHSLENLSPALVRYAVDDLARQEVLPAQAALQSVALASDGEHLYRIGGMTARNATGFDDEDLHSLDEVARLDEVTLEWTPAWPLPRGRSSHDAVVYGGQLYVFGGWTLAGKEKSWCEDGLALDLKAEAPAWRSLEQPFQRRALAVAAAGGRIYCLGGMTPAGETSKQVDVLDLQTATWHRGPDLPCNGFGITAIGHRDQLYLAGSDGVLYGLSADGSAWEPRGALALERIFARLVALAEGRLALAGGVALGRHVAVVEELARPKSGAGAGPSALTARMDLAFPGAARQRQAAFVSGDTLYLFGGNTSAEAHRFEPSAFTDEGFKVDLLSGAIARVASLPSARQSVSVALAGGSDERAFLVGGFSDAGEGTRSWDDVSVYDLKADRFEPASARLPAPLTQFGLTPHRGRLFAMGGLIYGADGSSSSSARAFSWHPSGEEAGFEEASFGLGAPRRAFAGGALGDEYVVVGGMGEGFDVLDTALALNLETGATRSFPSPEFPRVSGKLVDVGGRLLLAGGASRRGGAELAPDPTIEVFDAERGAWRVLLDKLPFEDPRHVQACAWRDRLLVFTTARDGHLDLLWLTP